MAEAFSFGDLKFQKTAKDGSAI